MSVMETHRGFLIIMTSRISVTHTVLTIRNWHEIIYNVIMTVSVLCDGISAYRWMLNGHLWSLIIIIINLHTELKSKSAEIIQTVRSDPEVQHHTYHQSLKNKSASLIQVLVWGLEFNSYEIPDRNKPSDGSVNSLQQQYMKLMMINVFLSVIHIHSYKTHNCLTDVNHVSSGSPEQRKSNGLSIF